MYGKDNADGVTNGNTKSLCLVRLRLNRGRVLNVRKKKRKKTVVFHKHESCLTQMLIITTCFQFILLGILMIIKYLVECFLRNV